MSDWFETSKRLCRQLSGLKIVGQSRLGAGLDLSLFRRSSLGVVSLCLVGLCLVGCEPADSGAGASVAEASSSLGMSQFEMSQFENDSSASGELEEQAGTTTFQQRSFGSDWPTFLGPTADGKSTETGILKDWTDGNLKVVWRKELGEGYGMGTVSAGRYFHSDRHEEMARVRCFNAETGEEIWTFEHESNYNDLYGYDKGPRASPVVDGDYVYIFGVEGMLHCLVASTGKIVWKKNTSEQFGVIQNFFGVASTPVVFEDLLLVIVGGSPEESKLVPAGALDRVKPNGSGIVAFDKLTGEVKYQVGDDLASYSTIKLATIDTRAVGFAWLRTALICFEPQTGNMIAEFPWRSRKLESVNASTPVVEGDHVLISECYEMGSAYLKLSGDAFEMVWNDQGRRDQRMASHWNTPVVVDGMLYGCSGRHSANATLRCVELATGELRWSKEGFERCSLTSIDGHLIVMDEAGRLLLIEANPNQFKQVTAFDGGSEKIRFKRPCWAAPIVSHGLMYVRGKDELVCFELIKRPK